VKIKGKKQQHRVLNINLKNRMILRLFSNSAFGNPERNSTFEQQSPRHI